MKLSSANINVMIKACRKASKTLIRDFGEIENLQVSVKGPGDFVTASDKKVEKILIEEPVDLRDMVWTAAQFTWTNEGETIGFIPTRYVNSHRNEDSDIKLARKTIWEGRPNGEYFGKGQRLFSTEKDEFSVMDIRNISFNVKEE